MYTRINHQPRCSHRFKLQAPKVSVWVVPSQFPGEPLRIECLALHKGSKVQPFSEIWQIKLMG